MILRPILLLPSLAIAALTHGLAQLPDQGTIPSAKELVKAMVPKPSSGFFLKMKMELPGENKRKTILQIQVKGRRIDQTTDLLYQIQFPKARQGESVLLRWKDGNFISGYSYKPGSAPEQLSTEDLSNPLFGSALTYHDTNFGFWEWDKQTDRGTEKIMGVDCRVIDSEPLAKKYQGYHRVRSYIDKDKLAPLVIEKFTGNSLAVVIRTDKLTKTDDGRFIARQYSVTRSGGGGTTIITGTKNESKAYPDTQFTREAIMEIKPK